MTSATELRCHCGAQATADSAQAGEIVEYLDPSKNPPTVLPATYFLEGTLRGWIQFHDGGAFCPAHGDLIRKHRI